MSWFNPFSWFKGKLKEASDASIFGTPVPWIDRFGPPGNGIIWGPEIFKDKLQTIRTIQQLNRARHLSRWLYERNPNAQGVVRGLINYVLGGGSTLTLQATEPGAEPPKRLTKQVDRHLTEWKKRLQWKALEREIFSRLLVDGEVFIQVIPREDGFTYLKFIEPDSIIPPFTESYEGPWSWGIKAELDDPATPMAYNLRNWRTGTEVQISAQFIKHLKLVSNRNQKRGIPALYACAEDLMGSQKLRHATREGQKVRSSIAYIREHEQAPQATVTALQDNSMSGSFDRSNSDGSTETVVYQQVEPGSVQDIPKGMQYKPPPQSTDETASTSSVRQSLEAVATCFNCPYWLVSGDTNSGSYANSLTSESPFIKAVETQQDVLGEYYDDIQTTVVEVAQEQGVLPESTLEEIDLAISFPSPVVRNLKDETERNKMLNEAEILSPQTWSSEEGLDYDRERSNFDKLPPRPETDLSPSLGGDPKTVGGQYKRDIGQVA